MVLYVACSLFASSGRSRKQRLTREAWCLLALGALLFIVYIIEPVLLQGLWLGALLLWSGAAWRSFQALSANDENDRDPKW